MTISCIILRPKQKPCKNKLLTMKIGYKGEKTEKLNLSIMLDKFTKIFGSYTSIQEWSKPTSDSSGFFTNSYTSIYWRDKYTTVELAAHSIRLPLDEPSLYYELTLSDTALADQIADQKYEMEKQKQQKELQKAIEEFQP